MRRILPLLVAVLPATAASEWRPELRREYRSRCESAFQRDGREDPSFYVPLCGCVTRRMEKRFSDSQMHVDSNTVLKAQEQILAACIGELARSTSAPVPPRQATANSWTDEYRRAFVASCKGSAKAAGLIPERSIAAYCRCALKESEKRGTPGDSDALGKRVLLNQQTDADRELLAEMQGFCAAKTVLGEQ